MSSFHEIQFPLDISMRASGGPERRTDIVATGSNAEERNARWANSRRKYEAGYGVRSLNAIAAVTAFFEERRGRLYGFRWRDLTDFKSCLPGANPAATDQIIATGDGTTAQFQLVKTYGAAFAPWQRIIAKPVAGSVMLAVNGVALISATDFTCDPTTGMVTLAAGRIPAAGASLTAGYLFDVPVRFDTDYLAIDLTAFAAGDIPKIPILEIIP
ncbi:MAG: TIGR02217 family protein [Hyphomicrobiales bacterium]|nr:TIGR02217 family protein [Hyphomicrobiales bacterium]